MTEDLSRLPFPLRQQQKACANQNLLTHNNITNKMLTPNTSPLSKNGKLSIRRVRYNNVQSYRYPDLPLPTSTKLGSPELSNSSNGKTFTYLGSPAPARAKPRQQQRRRGNQSTTHRAYRHLPSLSLALVSPNPFRKKGLARVSARNELLYMGYNMTRQRTRTSRHRQAQPNHMLKTTKMKTENRMKGVPSTSHHST
jgi:hypothetical protein